MPLIHEQNPWIQAAGVGGDAATTLGNLMVHLPQQRMQMNVQAGDIAQQQQQMALARIQSLQQQQAFPLHQQLLQGQVGLEGEKQALLQSQAYFNQQHATFLQQKESELNQKQQAIASLLQNNPQAASFLYGHPQFRSSGGITYDTTTGQNVGARLNPGQQLFNLNNVQNVQNVQNGNPPGIVAQSTIPMKQTDSDAALRAAGLKGMIEGTKPSAISNFVNQINQMIPQRQPPQVNGFGNMPQRDIRSNQIPQPAASPTNSVTKRWKYNPDGSITPQ